MTDLLATLQELEHLGVSFVSLTEALDLLLRDQFAIGVGDAGRLVDRDANQPLVPTAYELDFDQFHAFRLLRALLTSSGLPL